MKLTISERSIEKKREPKRIRREGKIPAILYSGGKEGQNIAVDEAEFSAALRRVVPGRLSTTVFTLKDAKGREHRAVIKDIQYKSTNYQVLHLDFAELVNDVKINVKVPIECIGVAECVGVKLGGYLRQVIRHVEVRCLPKDLPSVFEIDVAELGNRQYKKLKDLTIPETVKPLADLNEVVVVIAKR